MNTKETLKPLQKELVIIDTDFLFRENDFDLTLLDIRVNTDFYQICEQRYQEEKRFMPFHEFVKLPEKPKKKPFFKRKM